MATRKTDDPAIMNVYQKLQAARVKFIMANVDKSGKHLRLEYKYFSLDDIVPAAEPIFEELGLIMIPIISGETAVARVMNADKPDEFIDFALPYTPIKPIYSNSGNAVTNEMQATGSSVTYIRRYLWMVVLDIAEHDDIDGGEVEKAKDEEDKKPKKPATTEERKEIKKELTAAPVAAAPAATVDELKKLLKQLLSIDAEQEDFVQNIALKTEGFRKITDEQCAELVQGIKNMLAGYELKGKTANE